MLVRPGVRIGVDVGQVRVGVAASDPDGQLATPVQTLARDHRSNADVEALADLARDRAAVEVVVGLPRSLSGADGAAASSARGYAELLAARVDVPVRLVDERLSTVQATRDLRASGVAGRRQRAVVDQAAAVVVLQAALDAERAGGTPPGQLVERA
ncbi:MAG: putative pre6S rRNA nuclease [Frankiales bacterium]|jgi:putative Holliday junction resolvase|nr:putative pre6S rRNA nuclease [Frankiales bacterium]